MNSRALPAFPRHLHASDWGVLPDGRKVHRWTLRNAQDMRVDISDLGASILDWHASGRNGRIESVVLGHAEPLWYWQGRGYLGSIVGRWGNRIRDGHFELDGMHFRVDRNNNGHHLHGGDEGFHRAVWQADTDGAALLLSLPSADGDGGYPGNLDVQVRYMLQDDGTLNIDYQARSDMPTPVNLTSHPYFNLGGARGDIRDHMLWIDAETFLAVDQGMIPIAQESVAGTAFDFRHPAPLGSRLNWPNSQLKLAGGFDHCFCPRAANGAPREVAQVTDPSTGRRLTVTTDQPGLQFYTGQHLAESPDRQGGKYQPFAGFCLEAQARIDAINGPDIEQVVLRPGAVYRQHTSYRLDVV